MKTKRIPLMFALFTMLSTPHSVRPLDEIPRNIVIGTVGAVVVLCGVTYYYFTSGTTVKCCGCNQPINEYQDRVARVDCGHVYHRNEGCYAPRAECQECIRNNNSWATTRAVAQSTVTILAHVFSESEREKQLREQQEERTRKSALRAQTFNDQNVAMQNAAQDARPFYGNNPSAAQIRDQQQQILDEAKARKIAQEQSARVHGGYATPAQTENDQTNAYGHNTAVKAALEETRALRERQEADRRRVQKYSHRIFESEEEMLEICTICQCSLAEKDGDMVNLNDPLYFDYITTLPCGNGKHSFHAACIKDWSKRGHTCPNCRAYFDPKKL